MTTALLQLLGNYFCNSIASIELLEQIILGIIQVRNVNLTQLALRREGTSNQASLCRKIQTFFSNFKLSLISLAKILIKLAQIEEEKWLLAIRQE